MASQRIKKIFGLKTALIAISAISLIIIFFNFMNKYEEPKTVKVEKDDKTEEGGLDPSPQPQPAPSPSPSPPKPKVTLKDKEDGPLPEGGGASTQPNEENDKEYKKSEKLWLEISKHIEDKDLDSIKKMITLKPELVTDPIFEGKYFIHIACEQGYADLVTELIKLGCNVKIPTKDSLESQPIHLAAELETTEILEKLVEKGAEIDANDINGDTPLMYAVICEQHEPVKYLLGHGANPNLLVSPRDSSPPTKTRGETDSKSNAPIHVKTILNMAISLDHIEIVDLLLSYKADPALADSQGMDALHTAAFYGREEIVDRLLATGKVEVEAVVKSATGALKGKTAFDLAEGHESIRQKLKAAATK